MATRRAKPPTRKKASRSPKKKPAAKTAKAAPKPKASAKKVASKKVASRKVATKQVAPTKIPPKPLAKAPAKSIPPRRRTERPRAWLERVDEARAEETVARWVRRGEELLRRLAENGAKDHEYRVDLKEGRFVWIAPTGRVSAEAKARVVSSWSRTTSALAMAWADPLLRPAGIARVDGMPAERDAVDEETAYRVAMSAAEACGAHYLYRVPTPHAWYFVALFDLTFTPGLSTFSPGTPVGLVLRGLAETRQAIASRAEPADVVRDRLAAIGTSLLHEAEYAYRSTDWVARLERTGKRLLHLSRRVPRPSYGAIAAGRQVDEWLEREMALDLLQGLTLLEDEWGAFA